MMMAIIDIVHDHMIQTLEWGGHSSSYFVSCDI